YFGGRLINCMSNGNETHLMCRDTTLLRTSTDFWPGLPESHGAHLYCNAQVGMWFGQLIHPDWDMFQSNHERGAFHAAGRAISGGPVYVSDKPDGHNFDVLRKLVLSDGSVLRAERPGLPTRDCLFHDVTQEDVLLKIWNTNPGGTAVVGVFHCQYHAEAGERHEIAGQVTAPVTGAVFAHNARTVRRVTRDEEIPVRLPEGGWEIFTFARIENGFAALGLADKYNSGAAVVGNRLRDGGEFVAWCDRSPRGVTVNGTTVEFSFADGALWVRVPVGGGTLRVDFTG
ncbi:MAG: Sip1-related alpha-galactosidase, partial [Verrucomicrobiota bacterium]